MGFIDYHGTKLNRYEEVLGYARRQYEVESEHKRIDKVRKWIDSHRECEGLFSIDERTLLEYIIIALRNLENARDKVFDEEAINEALVGSNREREIGGQYAVNNLDMVELWADYLIHTVITELGDFNINKETRDRYLNVFNKKVLGINWISIDTFTETYDGRVEYRKYYENCFKLNNSGKHNFYRLIPLSYRNCNIRDDRSSDSIDRFFICYKQFVIMLSLFLYVKFKPEDNMWMNNLDNRLEVLDKLQNQIMSNSMRAPAIKELLNPFIHVGSNIAISGTSEGGRRTLDIDNEVRKQLRLLDADRFNYLLSEPTLDREVEAIRLILRCRIGENIRTAYENLIERISVLQQEISDSNGLCQGSVTNLAGFYLPNILGATARYVEDYVKGLSMEVINPMESDILLAIGGINNVINDIINEICDYKAIEARARARASDAMILQDGHVPDEYRMGD